TGYKRAFKRYRRCAEHLSSLCFVSHRNLLVGHCGGSQRGLVHPRLLRSTPGPLLASSRSCSRLVVIRSCRTVVISRNTRLVSVDRGLRNIALVREVILLNLSASRVLSILGRLAETYAS